MYKIYLNGEHYYTTDYYSDAITVLCYIKGGIVRVTRVNPDGETIIKTLYR